MSDTMTIESNSAEVEAMRLDNLLRSAASIGTKYKEQAKADKAEHLRLVGVKTDASADVTSSDRRIGGFATPMFVGLAMVAGEFARAYNNPDSDSARIACERAAKAFSDNFTDATEKTAKGGTVSGYESMIRLGSRAETARRSLQDRLEYWQAKLDEATKMDPGDARNLAIQLAKTYTQVTSDIPEPDGSWTIGRDGKRKQPKHYGRPATVIDGVVIPAQGGGTDRKALMSSYAKLVDTYGDAALTSRVADAWLSNGGKWIAPTEETVEVWASKALTAVEGVIRVANGGAGDALVLAAMAVALQRIAKEGIKANVVASTEYDNPPESLTPDPESESETVPETVPESEPVEGSGAVLGVPPATPTKPRAARKPGGSL